VCPACKKLSDEVLVWLSGTSCKWFAYGPADATATASSLNSLKSRIVFAFLVLAYPGCPGKGAIKRMFVLYYSSGTSYLILTSIEFLNYDVSAHYQVQRIAELTRNIANANRYGVIISSSYSNVHILFGCLHSFIHIL